MWGRPGRRAGSNLPERPQRVSDDPDPFADHEVREVREAKDLPAAIKEPDANVEVALLLRLALADGRSCHCTTCGAHQRSGATTAADGSSEEPADHPAEHRSAHWVPLRVPGGLRDPGDLTHPLRRRCSPGGPGRGGGGAGDEQYERHCYKVTVQVDLPSGRTGSHRSLVGAKLITPPGTPLLLAGLTARCRASQKAADELPERVGFTRGDQNSNAASGGNSRPGSCAVTLSCPRPLTPAQAEPASPLFSRSRRHPVVRRSRSRLSSRAAGPGPPAPVDAARPTSP